MYKNEDSEKYTALAKKALESYVNNGETLALTDQEAEALPEPLRIQKAPCFVSIYKQGELRGCIGTVSPTCACLAEEIIQNAVSAGVNDPRFPAVETDELGDLTYSVDILEEPEDIQSPADLDVKKYGVIVSAGSRKGLLLPDLDGVDSFEDQIAIARRKAGIEPGEPIRLQRFKVTRFSGERVDE